MTLNASALDDWIKCCSIIRYTMTNTSALDNWK